MLLFSIPSLGQFTLPSSEPIWRILISIDKVNILFLNWRVVMYLHRKSVLLETNVTPVGHGKTGIHCGRAYIPNFSNSTMPSTHRTVPALQTHHWTSRQPPTEAHACFPTVDFSRVGTSLLSTALESLLIWLNDLFSLGCYKNYYYWKHIESSRYDNTNESLQNNSVCSE